MIHSATATKGKNTDVPSNPLDSAGVNTAYTDHASAPANASRYGSGFAATCPAASAQSKPLLPPTASITPAVATTAPGNTRSTARPREWRGGLPALQFVPHWTESS